MCIGTWKTDASPSSPSFGKILESYSVTLWMAPETRANQTKVLVVRNWKSIWDAIRSTPGAFHPASVVELGRMSKMPALVGDKVWQGRKASMESLSTPLSRAGMDISNGRKQRCWSLLYSLLQMGASQSSRLKPLDCVLTNRDKFDPQSLKKTCLTFFCKYA